MKNVSNKCECKKKRSKKLRIENGKFKNVRIIYTSLSKKCESINCERKKC